MTEAGDSLSYNEFSWNQYANVLYLESPLGVGFSQNKERRATLNDLETAEINFNAIRDFMIRWNFSIESEQHSLLSESIPNTWIANII